MAPAVITKAQQQELAAVMIPLLRKQLTADVLKAAKLPPAASKTRAKSTTVSRDISTELLERMVHVEDEIKHLREDFALYVKRTDKHFEKIDKHFERVDQRFEKLDERFERIDKRFEKLDERFIRIDKRFERADQRFEKLDERFERIDKRFIEQSRHALIGFGFIAALIAVFRFVIGG